VSHCCTVSYKWVIVLDCVEFEYNDIISLYTKKGTDEEGQPVCDTPITKCRSYNVR